MSGEHTSLPDPLGGQVPDPGAEPTAPAPAPPDAAQEPVEDLLDLRVETEQYQVPRTTVQDLAARFGRREEDIVRVLQTGLDHSRVYGDLRIRDRELARREAELAARERELERNPPAAPPASRPKVEEDPVAFWNWTADRLGKLDMIDALNQRLATMEESQREALQDDMLAEQYWSIHEAMMAEKEAQNLPVVDGRTLARVIEYYGLSDRPGMSMEDKMEAAYRIASYGVPRRVQDARPAPGHRPTSPPRSEPPPPVRVPRAAPGPPLGPGEGPPGETLEQRRARLFAHPVANMTFAQLHAMEQAGE